MRLTVVVLGGSGRVGPLGGLFPLLVAGPVDWTGGVVWGGFMGLAGGRACLETTGGEVGSVLFLFTGVCDLFGIVAYLRCGLLLVRGLRPSRAGEGDVGR